MVHSLTAVVNCPLQFSRLIRWQGRAPPCFIDYIALVMPCLSLLCKKQALKSSIPMIGILTGFPGFSVGNHRVRDDMSIKIVKFENQSSIIIVKHTPDLIGFTQCEQRRNASEICAPHRAGAHRPRPPSPARRTNSDSRRITH